MAHHCMPPPVFLNRRRPSVASPLLSSFSNTSLKAGNTQADPCAPSLPQKLCQQRTPLRLVCLQSCASTSCNHLEKPCMHTECIIYNKSPQLRAPGGPGISRASGHPPGSSH